MPSSQDQNDQRAIRNSQGLIMAHRRTLTFLLVCAVSCFIQSESFAAWTVKVEAGKYDRLDGPVAVELPSHKLAKHPMVLTSKESNQEIPVQIDVSSDKPKLYFMLDEPLYKIIRESTLFDSWMVWLIRHPR
ncbi:MAG: hypothetical protein ACJZ8O_11495 [Pirellulaceae bacterium]